MKYMVADDFTIINPQGIRFVEKIDAVETWGTSQGPKHRLRVTYKGDVMLYEYASKDARDAQFNQLRAVLGPPKSVGETPEREPASLRKYPNDLDGIETGEPPETAG